MEWALLKYQDQQWKRLEKVLGTLWEYEDVNTLVLGEDGKVGRPRSVDNSYMRVPLALSIRPELLKTIKSTLRPPQSLIQKLGEQAKAADQAKGVVDLAETTTKEEFLREFTNPLGELQRASEFAAEEDTKTPPKQE